MLSRRVPRTLEPKELVAYALPRRRSRTTRLLSELAAEVLGALDLGTNNCRLLVARPTAEGGFRVIDAFSRIVRLGEGLAASGSLGEPAMLRTLEALTLCAGKIERRGVTKLRAVATEACRRAENATDFIGRVESETGITIEIISQNEEARLALAGCAPLLDPLVGHALIFDIGGGSTELSWFDFAWQEVPADARFEPRAWYSAPLGVVNLAERFGGASVSPAVYAAMVREVETALADFEGRHRLAALVPEGRLQLLGTSGTVTTLAGIDLGLKRYDRRQVDGCYLAVDTARAVSRRILEMTPGERAQHPCIGRERADLVVAGCAILEAICRLWPVRRLRVADRGLREGILMSLRAGASGLAASRSPAAFGRSAAE